MKKSVIAAVGVIALVGLAVAAIPIVEHHAAAQIRAEIERDGTTKAESVMVGLFDRSVTITNIRSTRVGTITAERWALSGLSWPLGELLKGQTPLVGWHLGDPIQADRSEVTNLRISDPGGQAWTVGSIVVEGLDLARYDGEVGPGPYRLMVLGARIMRALSVRRFEQRDFAFTLPRETNSIAVASITLEDFAHGRLGSFRLSGFRMTGSNRSEELKLDHLKAAGLDLEHVLTSMSAANWQPGMPLGRINLDSAQASGFGGETLASRGLALGSVTTESTHEAGGITRARTRIDGFVLAPPLRGLDTVQLRLVMTAMGLQEVKLGFDCSGVEDRGKGEIAVGPCALTGPDLGKLDLGVKLVQADDKFWRAIDSGDLFGIYGTKVSLGSARLVFADNSLLERSLKAVAAASGQPVAQLRATLAQQVRQFQPAGVLITDDMTKLLDTVARFVERGGTLAIDLKPDPPFGIDKIGYLKSPGPDLVGLLGVTATLSSPPR